MKIRHDEWGEVEGVGRSAAKERHQTEWSRFINGRWEIFYTRHGWSEVPETQLVDVTGEVKIDGAGKRLTVQSQDGNDCSFILPSGLTFNVVDRYDLPDLKETWSSAAMIYSDFERFLLRRKKPCLIIQKEESNG